MLARLRYPLAPGLSGKTRGGVAPAPPLLELESLLGTVLRLRLLLPILGRVRLRIDVERPRPLLS